MRDGEGVGLTPERTRPRTRPQLDLVTFLCYGALGCLGFLLNGLGPSLPFLQRDLQVTRAEVAWYPLLFAAGLLGVGVLGDRVVGLVGRTTAFWGALVGLCSGAALLAAAISPVVSGVGAGVMGTGGALVVLLVPAVLSDRHGPLSAGAIAEANAISSASSVLAPLLIGAAAAFGAGWRVGLLVVPLVAVAGLGLRGHRVRLSEGATGPAPDDGTARPAAEGPFFRRWIDVLLVVSIEFCMVFWSTDYLITEVGMGPSGAAPVAGLFLAGMAVGRAAGGQAAGRLVRPRPVFLASLTLTGLGFVLFWSTRVPAVAAAGLTVTGFGVALLYPLSLARALATEHERRDRASARAALASGLAIGIAPFALAALSADVGLRPAFLIVPLLVAGAFANAMVPGRRQASPGRRQASSPTASAASDPR